MQLITKGAAIAWLEEAAKYFANRPTGGEDAAFWANSYNAENARRIANLVSVAVKEGDPA